MYYTIRLLKRPDLDLITLYRGGVSLSDIFRKALYYYARGEAFRVAVEPVPPISLDKACERVITKPGYQPGTVVQRFVPIRINCTVSDPESIRVLQTARSAYGSTLAKQLIRSAIINLPLSSMMLFGSESRRAALAGVKRRRAYVDAELYREEIDNTVSQAVERENQAYEEALLLSDPALFIATRDGKLRAANKPAYKLNKKASPKSKPAKETSEDFTDLQTPVIPTEKETDIIEKPTGITLPKKSENRQPEGNKPDSQDDELDLLMQLGMQVSS